MRNGLLSGTERQLKAFQDHFGENPAHLSVHGHLHVDLSLKPFPWFVDYITRLSGGGQRKIMVRGMDTTMIRHTHAWEAVLGRPPMSSEQFGAILKNIALSGDKLAELVVHPAMGSKKSEPPLRNIYRISLLEKDLESLIAIVETGVIAAAGYE